MSLFTIYLASEKDKLTDEYIYSISDNKTGLIIQCCIVFAASCIGFIISEFDYVFSLPIFASIYNVVFVYLNLKKVEKAVMEKTPEYKIKFNTEKFFFLLGLLEELMTKNNSSVNDINKWKTHYIKLFKSELSLKNFEQTVNKIQEHIENIQNKPFTLNEKTFKNFIKTELNDKKATIFPEIDLLIKENKINISTSGNKSNSLVLNNENAIKNLKILGLSASTKNLNIVTNRYYELVKRYHPDISKEPESEARLAEINKAYKELKKYFKSS